MHRNIMKDLLSEITPCILCAFAGFIIGVSMILSTESTVLVDKDKDTGALITKYEDRLYKLVPLTP